MTQKPHDHHQTVESLKDMIACPFCDAVYKISAVPMGANAKCRRCGTVLLAPRESALTRIVMLATAAAVLMIAAVSFPFLRLQVQGFDQRSSVIDAILAFSDGLMMPLSFAVAATIVILPLARLGAIIYTLAPMAIGDKPAKYAVQAFRLAEALKPWAMAEIFIVGVAVALVKVSGLASVTLGPAFWAFVLLVLVTVLKDNFMSRLIIWKTLEDRIK
jgi:paraquat-inducible protein A